MPPFLKAFFQKIEVRTMSKVSFPFSPHRIWRDRRGGALALAAIVMVGLLAFMSLAVDLGMAFTAHTEAQRVADAAALAGASAFIDHLDSSEAIGPAKQRAREYAAQNAIRNVLIDTTTHSDEGLLSDGEELDIQIIPSEEKVRVWIQRQGLGVFLARFLGIDALGVKAMAAAEARTGGTTTCAWPLAIPDLWDDADDETIEKNYLPDPGEDGGEGEVWELDPEAGDFYEPWDGDGGGHGYGSTVRDPWTGLDHDYGLLFVVRGGPGSGKHGFPAPGGTSGNSGFVAPGNFMLYNMPDPENDCESNEGGGADWVLENLRGPCNQCGVVVDTEYETEPGVKQGPFNKVLDSIMSAGDHVEWDPIDQRVEDSNGNEVSSHSRIVTVSLYDPHQLSGSGSTEIKFNNFAKVFLEGGGGPGDFAITARFLGIVGGTEGPTQASLVKYLRLVE